MIKKNYSNRIISYNIYNLFERLYEMDFISLKKYRIKDFKLKFRRIRNPNKVKTINFS
jgi:hypothetical protein